MFTTLLCILFSTTLNFENLTLATLCDWYCEHPFLLMFAISEILSSSISINYKNTKRN